MTDGPFAECEERTVVRLHLADGTQITGSHTYVGRLHLVICHGPDRPLIGEAVGPFKGPDVRRVEIIKTRDEVLKENWWRLRGERVPGPEPVTRDDFQYRLEIIARAVATVGKDWHREMQLRRQFDDLADRIELAAAKRQWVLLAARYALRSNAPPTMAEIWQQNIASPSCLMRPRPQDFDPDRRVRCRRTPTPPHVSADPWSIPNICKALRAAGLKARVTRLGDPPWDRGHIQIDLPFRGRSRFVAMCERAPGGGMTWRLVWDGNESKAGLRRYRTAVQSPEYGRILQVLRDGRSGLQADFFVGTRPPPARQAADGRALAE